MSDVTKADRDEAAELVWWHGGRNDDLVGAIAEALAAERKKARTPFLALADELDGSEPDDINDEWDNGYASGHRSAADRIRRVAEQTP